jgi:hypothetical protein
MFLTLGGRKAWVIISSSLAVEKYVRPENWDWGNSARIDSLEI